MHMSFHKFPIPVPIPNSTAETIVQTDIQYVYATFGGPLTLLTDNWKEFKKLFISKSCIQIRNLNNKSSLPKVQWHFRKKYIHGLC